jgi:hypothetical protein
MYGCDLDSGGVALPVYFISMDISTLFFVAVCTRRVGVASIRKGYNHMSTFFDGSLIALGLFLVSVTGVHFANNVAYMYRKILHSIIQICGVVVVYYAAVSSILSTKEPRAVRYGASVVSLGIMPFILASRGVQFKEYHALIGKIGLVAYALTVAVLVETVESESYRWPSRIMLSSYIAYVVATVAFPLPTMSKLIKRMPDGRYVIFSACGKYTVEGGGWSTFLNRGITPGGVSTRSARGEFAPNVWGAGTTIQTVQATLRKRKQTLVSHPCILGATLGGWVFTSAHGGGGNDLKSGCGSIRVVTLFDCKEKTIERHTYPCSVLSPSLSLADQRRYLVLEVEVSPVENVACHLDVADISTLDDLHAFLHGSSVNRMIFFDRAVATRLVWSTSTPPAQRTLGLGSLIPLWIISLGPRFSSWVRRSDWNRTATLADANHFAPDPPYYSGLIARWFTNFEFFIQPVPDGLTLMSLISRLQKLFETEHPSARCEIRVEMETIYLDFSIVASTNVASIEHVVRNVLKPQSMYYHKGKYVPNSEL